MEVQAHGQVDRRLFVTDLQPRGLRQGQQLVEVQVVTEAIDRVERFDQFGGRFFVRLREDTRQRQAVQFLLRPGRHAEPPAVQETPVRLKQAGQVAWMDGLEQVGPGEALELKWHG